MITRLSCVRHSVEKPSDAIRTKRGCHALLQESFVSTPTAFVVVRGDEVLPLLEAPDLFRAVQAWSWSCFQRRFLGVTPMSVPSTASPLPSGPGWRQKAVFKGRLGRRCIATLSICVFKSPPTAQMEHTFSRSTFSATFCKCLSGKISTRERSRATSLSEGICSLVAVSLLPNPVPWLRHFVGGAVSRRVSQAELEQKTTDRQSLLSVGRRSQHGVSVCCWSGVRRSSEINALLEEKGRVSVR